MTIGTKIKWLMIFLIITLVGSSSISFWGSKEFINQIENLGQVQLPGVSNMSLADMMHDAIRANVLQAILVAQKNDPAEIKAVKDEAKEFADNINNYISELQKLNLSPETKKAIEPALVRLEEYIKSAKEINDIALSGDEAKARAMLPSFMEKFEALEKELGTLGDLIRADAEQATAFGAVIKQRAIISNIILLALGITLFVFFALVISSQQKQLKLVIAQLNNESVHINETAKHLHNSAQDLSDSTAQQSQATQESASALEEISSTMRTTETHTNSLNTEAKLSFETATNGKKTIAEMLTAMELINASNFKMNSQIEESNRRIADIVTIIAEIEAKTKVINDIVFQTKLLSFNASVEAARAGEQGKGFAVVAEEIGQLATMSGNAAKEISQILSNSINTVKTIVNESKGKVEALNRDGSEKVERGIDIAHKCGSALDGIVYQANIMESLIKEIASAIKEQAVGVNEVSGAISLLDQAGHRNATTSKENLETSKDLQDQVNKLEKIIDELASMMTRKD